GPASWFVALSVCFALLLIVLVAAVRWRAFFWAVGGYLVLLALWTGFMLWADSLGMEPGGHYGAEGWYLALWPPAMFAGALSLLGLPVVGLVVLARRHLRRRRKAPPA